MRGLRILVAVIFVLAALPAAAEFTLDRPLADPVAYHVDSGLVSNTTEFATVAYREDIEIADAGWMRLYFGDVVLQPGSFLRITAEADGEVQELDAAALEMWSNTSAYFNGDTVSVELVAGPQTSRNRLVIDQVASETAVPLGNGCAPGCCGSDDRVPSDEDWAARLLPAGCTASIYNTQSCSVSAGHCIGGSMVLEFKVPLSNPNCSSNHPPIEDQFPVLQAQFTNGGIANDWAAMTTGTNNLGQTAFERYGEFRPIAATPPQLDDPATVWGYGADDQCIFDAAQQTSDGFIEFINATGLRYSIDVTFGNSGSGVMRNGNEILGIVTHCCCPNWGTRVDHPAFVAARENLCPTSVAQSGALLSANVLLGTPVSGGVGQLGAADAGYLEVDSVPQGTRNSTLTEVIVQSPSATASELNVFVEYGPANAEPVFYRLQAFNNDSGTFTTLAFGIASTTSSTSVIELAVPNPNAYVDGSGQIRLLISQTARQGQTPSGFTKLLDYVEVTVAP